MRHPLEREVLPNLCFINISYLILNIQWSREIQVSLQSLMKPDKATGMARNRGASGTSVLRRQSQVLAALTFGFTTKLGI